MVAPGAEATALLERYLDGLAEGLRASGFTPAEVDAAREAARVRVLERLAGDGEPASAQAMRRALHADGGPAGVDERARERLGRGALGALVAGPVGWALVVALGAWLALDVRDIARAVLLTGAGLGAVLGAAAHPDPRGRRALLIGGGVAAATVLSLLRDVWSQAP